MRRTTMWRRISPFCGKNSSISAPLWGYPHCARWATGWRTAGQAPEPPNLQSYQKRETYDVRSKYLPQISGQGQSALGHWLCTAAPEAGGALQTAGKGPPLSLVACPPGRSRPPRRPCSAKAAGIESKRGRRRAEACGVFFLFSDRTGEHLSLPLRHGDEAPLGCHRLVSGPDNTAIGVIDLLHPVGAPPHNAGDGEQGGEQLRGDVHHLIDQT